MRLIDADALEESKFHSNDDLTPFEIATWQLGWNDAINAIINNAPTVDPIKHGHWIECSDRHSWVCSVCHTWSVVGGHYCDWCGAKMDEVEE